VADHEYPQRVGFSLLTQLLDEFTKSHPRSAWPTMQPKKAGDFDKFLAERLAKYQNPRNADQISQVQAEIDETKIVMYDTINKMLERGEKLDDLVNKSDELSAQSKLFYKSARKTNQCCTMW